MSLISRLLSTTMATQVPARFMSQLALDGSSINIRRVVEQNFKALVIVSVPTPLVKVDPFNPPRYKLIEPILMKALNKPVNERTEEDYDNIEKAEHLLDTVFLGSRSNQKVEKAVNEALKQRTKGV